MMKNNTENQIDPYQANGYADRQDYLRFMADLYGDEVYALADILGPNEDFDGLVSTCEDML